MDLVNKGKHDPYSGNFRNLCLMDNVLITGGAGFLGSHLSRHLRTQGKVSANLTRKQHHETGSFHWDPAKGQIDLSWIPATGTVVHLAGAGIADKRWIRRYKKEIIDSRVSSASLIFDSLKKTPHHVHTFISASAIGYYGHTGDVWVEENFHATEDFLGSTCMEWEKAARQFESIGIRVVILRIGLVLAKNGGALPKLTLPVKWFAGFPLGSGDQYMSWIHIEDLCRIFASAIDNRKMSGVYNAVAPVPVTNAEFVSKIAKVLHRPAWPIHVPSFVLRMILGEKASIVTTGQRVSNEKIRMTGFTFRHSDLDRVLGELV